MSSEQWKDLLNGISVPLIISLAASTVRYVRFGARSLRHFLCCALTSAFVAVLVFWGLDYMELPPTVDAAIIGFTAYMGGTLLDALYTRTLREVGDGALPDAFAGKAGNDEKPDG